MTYTEPRHPDQMKADCDAFWKRLDKLRELEPHIKDSFATHVVLRDPKLAFAILDWLEAGCGVSK